MYCSNCGSKLTEGGIVCTSCGSRIEKESYFKVHKGTAVVLGLSLVAVVGVAASFIMSDSNPSTQNMNVTLESSHSSSETQVASDSKDSDAEAVSESKPSPYTSEEVVNEVKTDSQVSQTNVPDELVEQEVSKIRGIYNSYRSKMESGAYSISNPIAGVTVYEGNGSVEVILVDKNSGDLPSYRREYYFSEGSLIFSYIESSDSNRLYFKNDDLFRWRHASNANDKDSAVNYDNQFGSDSYLFWENTALSEAYRLYNSL